METAAPRRGSTLHVKRELIQDTCQATVATLEAIAHNYPLGLMRFGA